MTRRYLLALKRSEEIALILLYGLLLLLETGYVAWLERLPTSSVRHESSGMLGLPFWSRPHAEVTLLLTLVGGLLAWSGIGIVNLLRHRNEEVRQNTRKRLTATAFYTLLAGANLLCVHLLN